MTEKQGSCWCVTIEIIICDNELESLVTMNFFIQDLLLGTKMLLSMILQKRFFLEFPSSSNVKTKDTTFYDILCEGFPRKIHGKMQSCCHYTTRKINDSKQNIFMVFWIQIPRPNRNVYFSVDVNFQTRTKAIFCVMYWTSSTKTLIAKKPKLNLIIK